MKLGRLLKGAVMAGIGLLSLMQTSAADFEIVPNKGKMSYAEKREAEQFKKRIFEVETTTLEYGKSKLNDILHDRFPITVFGRYGLGVAHCFINPSDKTQKDSLTEMGEIDRSERYKMYSPTISEITLFSMSKSRYWVDIVTNPDLSRDICVIKVPEKLPEKFGNKVPLYSGSERLLEKGREVFWIGYEPGLAAGTLKYYTSKIFSDMPTTNGEYVIKNRVTGKREDQGPRWKIEDPFAKGNSGATIYARAKGRGNKYAIPVGVATGISNIGQNKLQGRFRGMHAYLLEIEKYEAKTGKKNVEII